MLDLLNKLKESGMLYFFLVSLISSDTLLTVKDCENSITRLKELLEVIPQSDLTDEEKEKTINFCNEGIEICERDKKELEKIN